MAPDEDSRSTKPVNPPDVALSGQCQCSAITFTSTQLPRSITFCHCTQCQKMSGAPFIAFGSFKNSALQWHDHAYDASKDPNQKQSLRLRASTIKFGDTPLAHRGSCRNCGSPLFMKYSCTPEETDIALGIVDSETIRGEVVKPAKHILLKEKAKWLSVTEDGMERWDYFNDGFMKARDEWIQGGAKSRGDVSNGEEEEKTEV